MACGCGVSPRCSLVAARHAVRRSIGGRRTATPAQRVRLVVALSEAGGSLRCVAVSLAFRAVEAGGCAAYSFWIGTVDAAVSIRGAKDGGWVGAYLVTLWLVSRLCSRGGFDEKHRFSKLACERRWALATVLG
jgi:hypothetical protein